MKKILYLHAGAELYGADIVLLELLKNLDKKKFIPYVILPNQGPLVEKLKMFDINVQVLKYPILRRKYFSLAGIVKYIKEYVLYSIKLRNFAKEKEIDIIHTNTAAVLEGIAIKIFSKRAHVWHIHEIIVKPRIIHKFLSFLIARYANEVVVVSEAVKEHLLNSHYFKKQIRVIYNGVDNNNFTSQNDSVNIRNELGIPQNSKVVGMIGRINSWKGQKDFLKAMDIVLEENCDTYAMLVGGVFRGEEWRFNELEQIIKKMKNNNRVILSDFRSDIKNIHSLYDIFVLPSVNPDPLPTVVLEAMASGTPIIGYKHGGVCEMVLDGYNGFLVDVKNYIQLADKIELLLRDEQKMEQMSRNSVERQKNHFSMEAYIKNFTNLYNSFY